MTDVNVVALSHLHSHKVRIIVDENTIFMAKFKRNTILFLFYDLGTFSSLLLASKSVQAPAIHCLYSRCIVYRENKD